MATLLNPSKFSFKRFDYFLQKIITNNSAWFFQLRASKHYDELTLQRVIKYKFDNLLPNHTSIYYGKKIVSYKNKFDKCIPDFILWSNDYEEWYVIEVELDNHEINHIRKQLKTFYYGDYSDTKGITGYVKSKNSALDSVRFENLISRKRPRIILMADDISCAWKDEFVNYNCMFSTLQVYVDKSDNFIHRIGGELPQEYSTFTYCTLNKNIKSLDVHTPSFLENLGYLNGDFLKIFYHGQSDEWEVLIDNGEYMLIYNGEFMKIDETHRRWKLIQNNRNQLHLLK